VKVAVVSVEAEVEMEGGDEEDARA